MADKTTRTPSRAVKCIGLASVHAQVNTSLQAQDSLIDDARCLIGAGLQSLEAWREENAGADEAIWAAIYTLRMGFAAIDALANPAGAAAAAEVAHV